MKSRSKSDKVFTPFSYRLKKRGQLTIFVIIAILIVAVIFVYFLVIEPNYISSKNVQLNFDSCVEGVLSESINELSLTGGEIKPKFYYLYQDYKIPYYCYTNIPYTTCTVQQPMVKQFFEKQLKKYITEKINLCYENSVEQLNDLGYNVSKGKVDFNLTIIPRSINIEIYAPTTIEGQRFTTYRMDIDSEIYDILMVATSILQYESSYGDSSTSELMFYYPSLIIEKIKRGDSTTIYILTDKSSKLKYQFASRSLIWPAGYEVVEKEGYTGEIGGKE